jgi:hypothetical protein
MPCNSSNGSNARFVDANDRLNEMPRVIFTRTACMYTAEPPQATCSSLAYRCTRVGARPTFVSCIHCHWRGHRQSIRCLIDVPLSCLYAALHLSSIVPCPHAQQGKYQRTFTVVSAGTELGSPITALVKGVIEFGLAAADSIMTEGVVTMNKATLPPTVLQANVAITVRAAPAQPPNHLWHACVQGSWVANSTPHHIVFMLQP